MSAAKKSRISPNSVSLAGEFAVLSRLALMGYDANMTLGRTKSVDILVSDPVTNHLYQLEVKTKLNRRKRPIVSKVFGRYLTDWMMGEKHETISRPELWYCFVEIGSDSKTLRYFIVPSIVVAKYIRDEHRLWLDDSPKHKTSAMRLFRMGFKDEKYKVSTPIVEEYEDNWSFKRIV
jgi:hypothetical protein